jgi:hypothetical protein
MRETTARHAGTSWSHIATLFLNHAEPHSLQISGKIVITGHLEEWVFAAWLFLFS